MSPNHNNGSKPKVWLQELKSNRKTQVALGAFLVVLGYFCYELLAPKTSSQGARHPGAARNVIGQPLEPTQAASLEKLPNLAGLHKAGELPNESRMYRDIFLFDTPPPQPAPTPPPPPEVEKPPPTAEELAAAERRAAMDREVRAQPGAYKFIAILEGRISPRKGAFLKDDDIDFFKVGDEATPNWKLESLTEEEANFRNTRFRELTFSLKAPLSTQDRAPGQQPQVTNQF